MIRMLAYYVVEQNLERPNIHSHFRSADVKMNKSWLKIFIMDHPLKQKNLYLIGKQL